MDNELAGYILQWRWFYKKGGWKKSKVRDMTALKFRNSKKYMDGLWTTEMFCQGWDELEKKGMMK